MAKNLAIIFGVILLTGSMLVGSTIQVHGLANLRALSDSELKIISTDDRVVMELASIAEEAYLYARPMLDAYRDLYLAITDESSPSYIGEFNNIRVRAEVESESAQNIDINAWLDLRTEPLLMHVPTVGSAATTMQIADLHGDILTRITASGQSDEAGNYLIVSANWTGEVPAGVTEVIRSSTDLAQIWSSVSVGSAVAFEQIRGWGQQIALVPLSAYTMGEQPQPAPMLKLPKWSERQASGIGFIPYLNFMLRFTNAEGEEAEALERFTRIGIVAGVPSVPRTNNGAIAAGVSRARKRLEEGQAVSDQNTELAIIHQI